MKNCPNCQQAAPQGQPVATSIAIVGNMNVGKSTLFSRLCGAASTSINFPGTTVCLRRGRVRGTDCHVVDTPGIYSIFSKNEDEMASRDILLPGQSCGVIGGIIVVADAKNLRRSLAIVLQYAEYGLPMLLAVNMMDEAASRGITIDYDQLSELLGIDVCPTVAREGIGIRRLIARLGEMRPARKLTNYPAAIEEFLAVVDKLLKTPEIPSRIAGLLLLTEDKATEHYVARNYGEAMLAQLQDLAAAHRGQNGVPFEVRIGTLYSNRAEQLTQDIQVVDPPVKSPYIQRFGDWCTTLHTGIPIAIAILGLIYLFVGSFGATFLVDAINEVFFTGIIIPWITALVAPLPSPLLRDLIIDPNFGILPTGLFLAVGLVLPAIFCFYVAFGLLEDSGYLPRLSILLDKVLKRMGLNGKGVVPLIMGFSCVTMAILTTRMLDTEKEKNIASFLLFLGFPCAPFIAVMLIILERMPFSATVTVFGLILGQIFLAGMIANKTLPGAPTRLIMEIPPMRIPKPVQVLRMAGLKSYFFMKEAVPVFILASALVFFFDRIGGLSVLEKAVQPLLSGLMGLPEQSVQVFIKAIVRRESGAAELEHLHRLYSNRQLVVILLVMTFIAPCLNATIILFKERGIKPATLIMGTVMLYALVMGTLVNHFCQVFGITFS